MKDPREKLQEEGFSHKEVDAILERAVELQRQSEEKGYLDREDLREGAESAGIAPTYVDEAIRQVREEMQQAKIEQKKRRRLYQYIGGGIAVFLLLLFFFAQSSLNSRMSAVEKNRAQLENVLQRRHDLIPNLISVARSGAAHEKELVEAITRYQSESESASDFGMKQAWEQKLGESMNELLQSLGSGGGEMFTRLSDEMAGAENRIAYARKNYNEAVADYNRTARGFFISLVRPFTGYPGEIRYFEASEDAGKPARF